MNPGVFGAGSQQPSIQPGSTTHSSHWTERRFAARHHEHLGLCEGAPPATQAVYYYLALCPVARFRRQQANPTRTQRRRPRSRHPGRLGKRRPRGTSRRSQTLNLKPLQRRHNTTSQKERQQPGSSYAAAHNVSASPDDDDDLQDYEIIHNGDTFSDDENHAN
ncbi:hypothetical protein HPB50_009449 [Hyalomma asiaticum]|uniref:Uncharacterized protein n=1 Tax=Hyalomma asiaticum TaxID=266040 RepID=A0ACB7SM12_HYAAI|nr:hypothetical protein HPB50_009449 [Hyalomma asiaticum]